MKPSLCNNQSVINTQEETIDSVIKHYFEKCNLGKETLPLHFYLSKQEPKTVINPVTQINMPMPSTITFNNNLGSRLYPQSANHLPNPVLVQPMPVLVQPLPEMPQSEDFMRKPCKYWNGQHCTFKGLY